MGGPPSRERLRLHDNSITAGGPLSGLTGVPYLGLGGNSISDISLLSELSSLEFLRLDDNSITDIGALSELTSLKYLNLSRNPGLTNVQPLLDNPGLGAGHTVFLSGTSVSCADMAALAGVYVVGMAPCLTASRPAPSEASVVATNALIEDRRYQFAEAGRTRDYHL